MSYLEMKSSPLPDMTSGIISIWFREVSKQQAEPPAADIWPQDFWQASNASTTMVPPNAQYSIGYDPDFMKGIFFWNSYGMPSGGQFFGDLFLTQAAVWIPNAPPRVTNTMVPDGNAIGGIADTDMSKFGIRTLLTFGDPGIDYNYCEWEKDDPSVLEAVEYIPNIVGGPEYILPDYPPPYIPYLRNEFSPGRPPIGIDGKMKVHGYKCRETPTPKFKLPQSFIGIDEKGSIVINLQTSTHATYKGCSFAQDNGKTHEIWATATYLQIRPGPPYTYTQIGFPFPDGDWISIPGYWSGYEFEYKDISKEIMDVAPESFVIYAATEFLNFAFGAPRVQDGGWHHILFSFDISGSVTVDQSGVTGTSLTPNVSSSCQAWLAFDGKNIKGADLQNRPPVHDGFLLPKLRGTKTTQILDCGPTVSFGRDTVGLGDNGILPRNAWLGGWGGNPKDGGLIQYDSVAPVITADNDSANNWGRAYFGSVGDYNGLYWTGAIWPLYGGRAPGEWRGQLTPKKPSTPDPKTFDAPHYSASGFSIPCSGHPIGIPCSSDMAQNNTGVEMAELQIWANQTLDTSDDSNIKLFVDGNGKPTRPSVAAKKLGKPDILLHGSGHWKKGRNTGTTGIGSDGQINPDGQFTPVGGIEKFTPKPKLGA